ncbi:MAG: hypothetical protein A2Y78_02180 [Acidobacteria bacterium RBG_13_68_16]|nr:MAG: hypothetical protein A2Y78_02180 [Acidobacteria bacterium RBG_13_68_16]
MNGDQTSIMPRFGRRSKRPGSVALAVLLGALLLMVSGAPAGAEGVMGNGHVVFVGQVESLPSSGLIGDWAVSGKTVHVSADTKIRQNNGPLGLGSTVMVKGVPQGDGSINASSIEVRTAPGEKKRMVSFCGIIEVLPDLGPIGDWTVSGVVVHVTASTAIDETKGTAAVQVPVRVRGEVQADLSINATEIVVKEAMCGGFNQPTSMSFSVLHLKPTVDAPEGAEGVVITRSLTFVDGSVRKDLKVAVEHLLPGTAYDVMIDSFNAGPIMTNNEGEGHLFLSTADIPGAEPLPTELQDFDALQRVDVIDSGAVVMLTGDFADAKKVDRDHPGPDYLAVAILKDASSSVLGMAAAAVKDDQQELVLTVWGLTPGETYTLEADGEDADVLTASERGHIQVEYSTNATGHALPLPTALGPVDELIHVELQDSEGTTVVSGDFEAVVKPELAIIKKLLKRRLHR